MNPKADLSQMSGTEVVNAFIAITGQKPPNVETARALYFHRKLRFEYEVLKQRGLAIEPPETERKS